MTHFKKIILILALLSIPILGVRIYYDVKFNKIALLIEYHDLIEDYELFSKHRQVSIYLNNLKNLGLYNCFIKPLKILNFLSEYKEVLLLKSIFVKKFFPELKDIRESRLYLIIPDKVYAKVYKLPDYDRKFKYRDYVFIEYSCSLNTLLNMEIKYLPLYYKEFTKAGWNFFVIEENPVEGKIDSFLIRTGDKFFIKNFAGKIESAGKIHSLLKPVNSENELKKFVDENFRAIIERNVRIVWIKKVYIRGKPLPVPLTELLRLFKKRVSKYKIEYATVSDVMIDVSKNRIFFLWRIFFVLSLTIYSIRFFKLKFLLIYIPLLAMLVYLNLFHILILIAGMGFLNHYFFSIVSKHRLQVQTYIAYIGALFLLCIIISSFLMDFRNYIGLTNIYGIKIMFLLPFVITLIQFYYHYPEKFLIPVKWKDIILLMVSGLIIFIILLRSGNYWIQPSLLEIRAREILEKVFIIRPRFKEFLVGYPILSILFFFYRKNRFIKKHFIIFYFSGLIGVSTTLNSFLHIHTPFFVSLVRSIYGIFLGTLIGVCLYYIIIMHIKIHLKSQER